LRSGSRLEKFGAFRDLTHGVCRRRRGWFGRSEAGDIEIGIAEYIRPVRHHATCACSDCATSRSIETSSPAKARALVTAASMLRTRRD